MKRTIVITLAVLTLAGFTGSAAQAAAPNDFVDVELMEDAGPAGGGCCGCTCKP